MDLLILFYIFGGYLFVFLLYTLEPRGYYWGRIRGYEKGINDLPRAKKMIRQDVVRAREEVLVVSCTADLCLWDEDILREIEKKTSDKKGVKFVFLVGPNINNTLLQKLAEGNENVLLRILEDNPPCDFRIIDRNGTYVSTHECDAPQSKYYRTFGSVPALRDRIDWFNKLCAQSKEYGKSA